MIDTSFTKACISQVVLCMTAEPTKTLKLFYCYAREDKALREELERHLASLKRQQHITTWYDREILPGAAWEKEIDTHLNAAHIILLIVSPDFMDSDYCYGIEMKRALERHEAGTARVIPIIVRPVDWVEAPFSHLQVLPTDAQPITLWSDRDHAFTDIARHIRTAVKDMQTSLMVQELLEEGTSLKRLKRYEEAITAYDQAIRLDPNNAVTYYHKANCFQSLKRYEEALTAYDQAIRLNPNDARAYYDKGNSLNDLQRYEEALTVYDQAIRLDPNHALAYYDKGDCLRRLKRYEEALTV